MELGDATERKSYSRFYPITTRWMDNDQFGHVNNVIYYSYFDTVINRFIALEGKTKFSDTDFSAFIVHSECAYLSPISFPDEIEGALRINKIGNSSVQYGLAIFSQNPDSKACAYGTMTHVFVDSSSQKPILIPEHIKHVFLSLTAK